MMAWVSDLYGAALQLKHALLGRGGEVGYLERISVAMERQAKSLEELAESNRVIASALDGTVAETSAGMGVRVYNMNGH